ncbi:MAG: LPS export ABC transporter periplasmic protein LptC [Pseudomonadota bacterium]|nr:LPS export ABC transporter periplasmic protein LptC [Pseudomonadota bacterium]MEE3070296.1 LPS export ABC transporter periplasmic protein LptC [Pseudomonadota bacterium]
MADKQRNTYSVVISWVKIVLPLVAVLLLSSIFLLSRRIDPEAAIPYAEDDIIQMIREQRLSKPDYQGKTRDGGVLSVSAEAARPSGDGTDEGTADDVVARLTRPDGTIIDLVSDYGDLSDTKLITFSGKVQMNTSDGYQITSERVISSMEKTDVVSPGPVTGTGPFGRIDAGNMHLTIPEGQDQMITVFENGVHLIYSRTDDKTEEQN